MIAHSSPENIQAAIVFAGGMALGAYQAGAYEQFIQAKHFNPDWVAGSSIGAVNAALIAGNAPEDRIARLREFWSEREAWYSPPVSSNLRYPQNWMSAIQTRLFGVPDYFRPRLPGLPSDDFKSLHDPSPMRRRLQRLIDFTRLNSGERRLSPAPTKIERRGRLVRYGTREAWH